MKTTLPIKCDICYQPTDKGENTSKCIECKEKFHLHCQNNFYNTNHSNYKCYKCVNNTYDKRCVVCNLQGGVMLNCNDENHFIHSLCLSALKDYFFINEANGICMLNIRKLLKKRNRCAICHKKTYLGYHCNDCNIMFHPYCGFNKDFDVLKQTNDYNNNNINQISFPCNSKHMLYSNNIKLPHSMKIIVDDDEIEIANNEMESVYKEEESKESGYECFEGVNIYAQLKLYHNNDKNLTCNNDTVSNCNKNIIDIISTVNLKLLHKKVKQLNKDIYNKYNWLDVKLTKTKSENNIKKYNILTRYKRKNNNLHRINPNYFDWKITDPYFLDLSVFKLNKLFPKTDNSISNNSNTELKYILCQFNKKRQTFYSVYDISNMNVIKNINDDDYTLKDFLQKKRTNIQKQIRYVRGFKLNSLSTKILSLEKTINSNLSQTFLPFISSSSPTQISTLPFIDKELYIKEQMLSSIIQHNNKNINKIKISILKEQSPKTSTALLHSLNSENIYISITSRLITGVLSKSLSDFPLSNPNTIDLCECCVCFDFGLPSSSLNTVVYCDKCNVGIHPSCYGIQKIPEASYYCDKCTSKSKNIKCVLCDGQHGALKKIEHNLWAHVTCVLISNCYMFKDYVLMNSVEIFHDELSKLNEKEDKCEICFYKGELFKCKTCNKLYHFFCAYFEGYYLSIKYIDDLKYPRKSKVLLQVICCVCGEETGQWSMNDRLTQRFIRKKLYQK